MSGIYIHIPFCKKICYYCDFYFSLNLSNKKDYLVSLLKEIEIRKDYLCDKKIETIYFGGGTPSVLSALEINQIYNHLSQFYELSNVTEITLEANPNDLSYDYLYSLKKTKINRLSIGIQSFDNNHLMLMNRRHNSDDAFKCVKLAQDFGFENITIDLMYGLPELTSEKWLSNINFAITLGVKHISAYHLSIEPHTAFHKFLNTKRISLPTEDESLLQYNVLVETLKNNGFLHYEISNFALNGYLAIHNSNYWKQKNYIGFGSSAHSFNGSQRQWNISNNFKYINALNTNTEYFEVENLLLKDKFNEYLLTSLRTFWGVDITYIKNTFPIKYCTIFENRISHYLVESLAVKNGTNYSLTEKGFFVSDTIISDLFVTD